MIEILSMSLSTQDFIIGWDIEIQLHEKPTAKKFFERAVFVLGLHALECFMDYAMLENKEIDISIDNNFGRSKQLTFDPFSAPTSVKDDPIALLIEVMDDCLQEFIKSPDPEETRENEN